MPSRVMAAIKMCRFFKNGLLLITAGNLKKKIQNFYSISTKPEIKEGRSKILEQQ